MLLGTPSRHELLSATSVRSHSSDAGSVGLDDGGGLSVTDLTHDHKLELEDEKSRIEATGAYATPKWIACLID